MPKHIVSPRIYFAVFAALLAMTLTTVVAAFLPLGNWHTVVALTIAVCKAALVILFFMHVLYSGRLTKLLVVGAFFWFGILMTFTMADYLTRNWLRY